MKHHLSLLTGAVALAAAAGSYAQTAVTDPVGYITLNVRPAGTLSFVAPSLVNKVEFSGVASAATATSITVSGAPFAAGAFNPNTAGKAQYYVEVTNGTGEGAWTNITGNTTSQVTTADDMTAVITAGTSTIKIRKHVTIADMFGATNSAGLKSGDQISAADEIKVLNSETKAITSIFYYDDGVAQAWVDADFAEVPDYPIEPQQGLYINRKLATPVSFVRVGHVKTGKTMLTSDPGINIVAVPRAVGSAFTLGNSNLTNAGAQSGRVKSSDQIATADVLKIQQASGGLKEFFHYDDGVAQAWVDADFNELPGEQLNEGTSFVFLRQPSAGTFTWTVPAETIAP
jgi:uncharacterized protein (TIGR02597 family)